MDIRNKTSEKANRRCRNDLDNLFEQITEDNQPESIDDAPVGEGNL